MQKNSLPTRVYKIARVENGVVRTVYVQGNPKMWTSRPAVDDYVKRHADKELIVFVGDITWTQE